MKTAEARAAQAPTDDEIAAAVIVIHILRGRAELPAQRISGWQRAARAEGIGVAPSQWGRIQGLNERV